MWMAAVVNLTVCGCLAVELTGSGQTDDELTRSRVAIDVKRDDAGGDEGG